MNQDAINKIMSILSTAGAQAGATNASTVTPVAKGHRYVMRDYIGNVRNRRQKSPSTEKRSIKTKTVAITYSGAEGDDSFERDLPTRLSIKVDSTIKQLLDKCKEVIPAMNDVSKRKGEFKFVSMTKSMNYLAATSVADLLNFRTTKIGIRFHPADLAVSNQVDFETIQNWTAFGEDSQSTITRITQTGTVQTPLTYARHYSRVGSSSAMCGGIHL